MNHVNHIPVMLKEVLKILDPKRGQIYVDATVGLGGHAREILRRILPDGMLIGLDRDEKALEISKKVLGEKGVKLVKANFKDIKGIVESLGVGKVDGVLFDLGVSSLQLEDEERGFSFSKDGPLDMRMGKDGEIKAMDLINRMSVEELSRIFKLYGEERNARLIAKAIVDYRKKKEVKTTLELVNIIRNALPKPVQRKMGKHPARRVFQALRIVVNDELNSLEEGLEGAFEVLKEGGKICVISYHSLEDRMVKRFFKKLCDGGEAELLLRKVLRPCQEEIARNPRSRSARLRAVRRMVG